jgi:hypothetical protein
LPPAADQPDAKMLAPAHAVARFIATGDEALLDAAFAPGPVTILENFAPFLFQGADAAARWAKAMMEHASGLGELKHTFGPAFDFGVVGGEAYFSLPTTWHGVSRGQRFIETGGWSFLMARRPGGWGVRAYGWAVTGLEPG